MNENSLVSVIVPTYNVEKYLAECINSLSNQKYKNLQLLLVDDGSTDKSGEMCDTIALVDSRVVIVHKSNNGQSSARNCGIELSSGEYIYFIDSDDYITNSTIDTVIDAMKESNADFALFDANVFSEGNTPLSDFWVNAYHRRRDYGVGKSRTMLAELLREDEYRAPVWIHMYRKEYLLKNNLRFVEKIVFEDECFSFHVYAAGGLCVHIKKNFYQYRRRAGSIMSDSKNALKKFYSMKTIYYDISDCFQLNRNDASDSLRKGVVRIANAFIRRYDALTTEQKKIVYMDYRSFLDHVNKNNAYNDLQLRIKCSSGFKHLFLRGLRKFQRFF